MVRSATQGTAINGGASRLGGVIAIAVLPALIGASGGRSVAHALAHGSQPATSAVAGIGSGGALIAGLFVADDRTVPRALAPPAPHHGCVLPVSGPNATPCTLDATH